MNDYKPIWDTTYLIARRILSLSSAFATLNDIQSHKYALSLASYHQIKAENSKTKDEWVLYGAAERLMKFDWHLEESEFSLSITDQNLFIEHVKDLYRSLCCQLKDAHDEMLLLKDADNQQGRKLGLQVTPNQHCNLDLGRLKYIENDQKSLRSENYKIRFHCKNYNDVMVGVKAIQDYGIGYSRLNYPLPLSNIKISGAEEAGNDVGSIYTDLQAYYGNNDEDYQVESSSNGNAGDDIADVKEYITCYVFIRDRKL